MQIIYSFTFSDAKSERIELEIDETTLLSKVEDTPSLPDWTQLEFKQCKHCPLEPGERPDCPVASRLASIMTRFDRVSSFDTVELEVQMPERTIKGEVASQQALSSLMGLVFATSGCPYTDFMKPMSRFHLPLATEEDTIFRATGMYLIAQYYRKEAGMGHDLEFDGLKNIYANLHKVNTGIADRIRTASQSDSSTNAVVLLDMLTHIMPFAIEDKLDELRHLFHAYVGEDPLDDR